MDQDLLAPAVLSHDPSSPDAHKYWRHWKRTFDNFIDSLQTRAENPPDKLATLVNFVDPSIYELISECEDYDTAIGILTSTYVKPKNVVLARYLLSSCKQERGHTLDEYLHKLETLANDCEYKALTAEQYKTEAIMDAFIGGLSSDHIRQRLLECSELTLDKAVDHARSLEMTEKQSSMYKRGAASAATDSYKCVFCGYKSHSMSKCPARDYGAGRWGYIV